MEESKGALKNDLRLKLGSVNRILVRGVNWVGDTVLSYPAIEQLKTIFPKSHSAILVPSHLVDLWKTVPYVDEIIPFDKKGGLRSVREDLTLGRSLKERKFDLALVLPRSFRSAFQVYLARIPIRIGFQEEGRSFFLTHGIDRTRDILQVHRVHYYFKLLAPFGETKNALSPRIWLRAEDRRWAEQTLKGLGILNGEPLVGMNPGATYGLAKCWSPARFGELGKRISERGKARVLLLGKEGEEAVSSEILKQIREGGVDLTGKTRLLQLAALLERCHLLVTNDTGTMHVAAAVGTPVVALFGSTDQVTTGPWGKGHVVMKKDVSCSPCLKRTCPTDHRCMDLITVDEVEEAVNKKLGDLLNNQIPRANHQIRSNNQ